MLKTDVYKLAHSLLYPKGLTKIYSTLIPRRNDYFPYDNHMTVFGYQMFIESRLIEDFDENFFNLDKDTVESQLHEGIDHVLGKEVSNKIIPKMMSLWKLGHLPVKIKALDEGTQVPMGVPVLTIESTNDEFPWIANYLETMLLSDTFVTSTGATIARQFRLIGKKYADKTADDSGYLDYQFHDFSERGQHGNDAAILSGISHLTSFKGSDVIQAPLALAKYYYGNIKDLGSLSASVVASEHSVMEALGGSYEDSDPLQSTNNQIKVYKELIKNNPNGVLSLVSDTYDYWEVINTVLPTLKDDILARNGKMVIRPDSLDNVEEGLVRTLESLWNTFGGNTNSKGYKVLDSHVGVLHGEGVTLDNVEDIFDAIVDAGFSAENIILGVGAYVYSVLNTRDTFGQAVKAQLAVINGEEHLLFKDPKTDTTHLKRSLKGAVVVKYSKDKDDLIAVDNLTLEEADNNQGNLLKTIFDNGESHIKTSIYIVRENIKASINKDLQE